ncbi:hypothetical protein HGRIS_012250 [Hohenbuehelia grisea]|uniref:DUF202 domain-containing protein n=1 Tax=Hohenbuehelia grisea TaxID=104357 RepID=A0ABR3IRS3_9AGAR
MTRRLADYDITTGSAEAEPLMNGAALGTRSYSSTISHSKVHTPVFAPSTGYSTPRFSLGSESVRTSAAPTSSPSPHPSEPSSFILQNTNSVARDHLASERTFLAYVRTCLAITSAGVALSQLLLIHFENLPPTTFAWLINLLTTAGVLLGLYVLGEGHSRYFAVQSALMKDKYPVARMNITMISMSLGVLVLATFVVMVLSRQTTGL